MYDRILELLAESMFNQGGRPLAPASQSKLATPQNRKQRRQLRNRLKGAKFGTASKPQPSRDPEASQDLARLARVKRQHSKNPLTKLPGLGRLATAVRDRRAQRIMKARGMDPVTGKIRPDLAADPRSRLEKAVMKRGETIPQYLFQKLRKGLSTSDAQSAPNKVY